MRFLFQIAISLLAALAMVAAEPVKVRLKNSGEVTGRCLNPSLTIHAAYGSLATALDDLVRIEFGTATANDVLITASGNRLSGFLNDEIRVEDGSDSTHKWKRNELATLKRDVTVQTNLRPFARLVNGDVLAGEITVPALAATSVSGSMPLDPATIHSIWFRRNDPNVEVQLVDGRQIEAPFPEVAVRIRLGLPEKPEVELGREFLKTLYLRGERFPYAVGASGDLVLTNQFATPPNMVWIPAGTFWMGSPLDERGRNSDEDPRTQVTISRGFWMARFEVTQAEYVRIIGNNPSTFHGDLNRPVEKVSWQEANEYCARLTSRGKEEGNLPEGYIYRLPTEAEWEYACRAGTTTRFSFGDDPDERELENHAWFVVNSAWTTHPVGKLKANPWGLHDMHGNVLEWCAGIWSDAYPGGLVTDYAGPSKGWLRVARGGSWLYSASFARSANRDDYGAATRCSDLGFRVVLAPTIE